ncbi:Hypothetical protein SMAX5B_010806 [Scophthalmus maximus]|uniref:Uncharacterized protein n=1 Tax=Scophthalmus maximus TaxID=52904 RepID=A0A2U9BR50_SCOMX|nr:Hypothetical protein SMAX5B_010806 [Scophthalmus maximus]
MADFLLARGIGARGFFVGPDIIHRPTKFIYIKFEGPDIIHRPTKFIYIKFEETWLNELTLDCGQR